MSFQAMTWAVSQKCGGASTKLVLMMLANHANGHTGQCNPRHKLLAAECEMSIETLKSHLKKLAELDLIEIVPQFAEEVQLPNQYVLNFQGGGGDFWGEGRGENSPPYNQERNQERNHPHTPRGGDSKPEAPKPEKPYLGEREVMMQKQAFADFWKAYPKKVGKDAAERAWARKVKTRDTIEAIMKAVAAQRASKEWTKDDGQYIPNPATWLNQGRWKDDDDSTQATGSNWRSNPIFAGVI